VDSPPIFLLAYANDRSDDGRYLRNLPEERRQVKAALRAARDLRRCEIIECANATVEELLDECQGQGRRLAVFHFAGHADGQTLLFEHPDGRANATVASSIAEFLGGIASLKLVVLNGCSTQQQVDMLLAHGIPAVVATSTSVRDDVATEFAVRFYRALADSASIAEAFRQSSGAVKSRFAPPDHQRGTEADDIRAVSRDILAESSSVADWPWQIYGSEAATSAVLVGDATAIATANRGSPATVRPWRTRRRQSLIAALGVLAGGGSWATLRAWQPDRPALVRGSTTLTDGMRNAAASVFQFSTRHIGLWNTDPADIAVSYRTKARQLAFFLYHDAHPYADPPGRPPDRRSRSGIQPMPQPSLELVESCPADGYSYHWLTPTIGRIYCVRTLDGQHYAKLAVTNIDEERGTITFDWVYQPTASRDFE
jgi:hypothetical protein